MTKKFSAMLFRKEVLESIILKESGSYLKDSLAIEAFSEQVQNFIESMIVASIPHANSSEESPLGHDISEESLMRDLEGSQALKGNIITMNHVQLAVVKHSF